MELSEIREKINETDREMLNLFLQRMDLSEEVAAYKKERNMPILDRQREREILAAASERAGERERYAYHFFTTILELGRTRQAELIAQPGQITKQVENALKNGAETGAIACQGVEGGNSETACDRIFPRGMPVFVRTFEGVASAVESGLCKFGVLPIENSSNGSVRTVYDILQDHQLSIVRMTRLHIRHELLVLPGAPRCEALRHYGNLFP